MIATFLLASQLPAKPGPLGPPTPIPAPVLVRLAPPESWRVEPIKAKREPEWNPHKVTVTVAGKRVVIVPKDGYNKIDGVEKGSDGSLLIHRAAIYDPTWSFRDSIWYRGKETPISGAQIYRDRLNYVGSFIRETNALGMPESAPEAQVVEKGRKRALGWGSVRAWTPDGTFVLEVPVDGGRQPSGTEFTSGAVTRILSRGHEWRVPDYGYIGRMKDGTLVLASGATSSSVGNGFISLSKESVSKNRVLFWRDGRLVSHAELPERWRVAGLAPDGWLLVRRSPETKAQQTPSFEGKKAEEVMAAMERMADEDHDALTQTERDWTAGVLRGTALTPISLPKPKGAEKLLWRGGATAYGPQAFRFMAFWGDEERHYRVSRR